MLPNFLLGLGCSAIVAIGLVVLVSVAGYVSNIVQLVHLAQADSVHALFWVKLVGCAVAPLGAIMGVVGWF